VNDIADAGRARWEPAPYLSALVGGCLESGRDSNAGGAHFNYLTVEGVALATAADSLAAVKKLVYEQGQVKMEQLLQAIQANFEGFESLRQTLLNKAPKYGNDDPYADQIAHDSAISGRIRPSARLSDRKRYRRATCRGIITAYARRLRPPDGRRRGSSFPMRCPVNGADRKGPTSVVGVGSLVWRARPTAPAYRASVNLRTEGEKLIALLRAYDQVGGTCLQVNVIDAQTLRQAQKHPDEYRNLLVRVTGYHAYFTGLGKEIQDEIIARESHLV
jgi:formate C-acetyltransferase